VVDGLPRAVHITPVLTRALLASTRMPLVSLNGPRVRTREDSTHIKKSHLVYLHFLVYTGQWVLAACGGG
jgi:hypothetical protein